ncbi:MAG: DMT family transporter [Acetobacterales bacterium]
MNGIVARLAARAEAIPPNVRGAMWMTVAAVTFAGMATMMKVLGQGYHSFQVTFFRAFAALLILLPIVVSTGREGFRTERPGLHVLRGLAGATSNFFLVLATALLPLADAVAYTFTKPLWMTVLAAVMLSEFVGRARWMAVGVGFLGVIVMMRPGTAGLQPEALVALGGAFMFALTNILVKMLAATERPVTIMLYAAVTTTVLLAIPAALVWKTPDADGLLFIAMLGFFGVSNQYFMIRAFAVAEASAVIPFDYTRLIWSVLIGFVFFSELPDLYTVGGALIIVGSTYYIARREARMGRAPKL